jgi:hypothetical protein
MEAQTERRRHTVEYDGALPYTFEHQIAGAYGDGEHKELTAVVTVDADAAIVSFEVRERKQVLESTPVLREAVRFYNEL